MKAWVENSTTTIGLAIIRRNEVGKQDEVFNFTTQNFEALPTTGLPTPQQFIKMNRFGPGGSVFNGCQYATIPDSAMVAEAALTPLFLNGDGTLTVNSPGSAGDCLRLGSGTSNDVRITISR